MRRNNPNAMPTMLAPQHVMHAPAPMAMMPAPPVNQHSPATGGGVGAGGASPQATDEVGLIRIESPMVGTFYAQANPDTPPSTRSVEPVM